MKKQKFEKQKTEKRKFEKQKWKKRKFRKTENWKNKISKNRKTENEKKENFEKQKMEKNFPLGVIELRDPPGRRSLTALFYEFRQNCRSAEQNDKWRGNFRNGRAEFGKNEWWNEWNSYKHHR